MTTIASHLSVEALRDRYVSSADVMEARLFSAGFSLRSTSTRAILGAAS